MDIPHRSSSGSPSPPPSERSPTSVPGEVAVWLDKRGLTLSGQPLPTRRDALDTRKRLLEAAATAFATAGYANTNLRDIASAAGANLSSVNKLFGTKEGLYREVLVSHQLAMYQDEAPPDPDAFETPEEALQELIRFQLRLVHIRRSRNSVTGQLIVHEIQNPTAAIDDVIDIYIAPVRRAFETVIGHLLGDADSPKLRRQMVDMVFGLCVFQGLAARLLEQLGSKPSSTERGVKSLAETIYVFALNGIRGIAAQERSDAAAGG